MKGIFAGLKNMNIVVELPEIVDIKLCVNFINYKLSRALYCKQNVTVDMVTGIKGYEQNVCNNIVEDILVQAHILPVDLVVDVNHYARNDILITIRR